MADNPTTPLPGKPSLTPKNGTAAKQETIRLAIRLASVVLLTASVIGFLCLSGRAPSIEQILLVIAAGGALAGLAAAPRAGGGGSTLAGGALMLVALTTAGCSGPQHVATPEDCATERRVVTSLDAAIDVVDIAVPAGVDGRDETLAYSREGVALGTAAVEACEALRDDSSWMSWVGIALKVVRGLVAILRAANVEIPGPIGDLLDLLVDARDVAPDEGLDVAASVYAPAYW